MGIAMNSGADPSDGNHRAGAPKWERYRARRKPTHLNSLVRTWAEVNCHSRGGCWPKSICADDELDARRYVGFIVAEELLAARASGLAVSAPDHYVPYLHNLGLEEFKRLRAYYAWERNGGHVPGDPMADYLAACDLAGTARGGPKVSLAVAADYLHACWGIRGKITRRKAYWLGLSEPARSTTSAERWHRAERFVETFYAALLGALRPKAVEEFNRADRLARDNEDMLNMMELLLVCCCAAPGTDLSLAS